MRRDRSQTRLTILAVFVMSLVATLALRAFALQVPGSGEARAAAADNRQRELVLPATRGMILDQLGRPLAANRIALDVAVSRRTLAREPDDGAAALARLGETLGMDPDLLGARLRNCGTKGASPQPNCWNGAPGADPTVASDIGATAAGRILAEPEEFPGISVQSTPVRDYPGASRAAHALGHVGAVTAEDLTANASLAGISDVGRAGLEAQYDAELRGVPGLEQLTVDSSGHRVSSDTVTPAVAGQTLVTHLDSRLQAVVEAQLAAAIQRARGRIDPDGKPYKGDGGAAVVLDVRTGAVLALASAPTFDANLWTGGISSADYARLVAPEAGEPLLDRSVSSAMAPASTFKVVSTAAALKAGYTTDQLVPCPSKYVVGGRAFKNYESRARGDITLGRAIEVSCDTSYYRIADALWRADGGVNPVAQPTDLIAREAQTFGFGARTGIDLPGESAGQVASRATKQKQWDERHVDWCNRARTGYPELADKSRAAYLQALAAENCTDGMRWRVGDALNAAIGQGDTTATVLQLAAAYAAIANGGTLYQPQVGSALLAADGSVARRIEPVVNGRLDVSAADLAYLRDALQGVVERGSARKRFADFPWSQVPLAAKTGTAEVAGRQATAWMASFAPADNPRYAVVMTVSQGGTGAGTTGPSIAEIYRALLGVRGAQVNPAWSVLAGGDVAQGLPTIGSDGVPVAPPTAAPATPPALATPVSPNPAPPVSPAPAVRTGAAP